MTTLLPRFAGATLIASAFLAACGGEPVAPTDEGPGPQAQGGKDDSLRTPPQRIAVDLSLAEDGRALRLLVRNDEPRDVFCRAMTIRAATTTLDGCPGEQGVEHQIHLGEAALAPGGTRLLGQAGVAELATFESQHAQVTGRQEALRYCYVPALGTDCGFSCADRAGGVRRYGDTWTAVGASHEIIDYRCEADGGVQYEARCEDGYYRGTSGCVEAGCGAVPHGGQTSRPVANGQWVGRCDRGLVVEEHLQCSAGFLPRATQTCERARACGAGHPDGDTWHVCIGGRTTYYRCADGRSVVEDTRVARTCSHEL